MGPNLRICPNINTRVGEGRESGHARRAYDGRPFLSTPTPLSHRWLAFDLPDPNNVHFQAVCQACEFLITKEEIPAEDLYVWVRTSRYCTSMARLLF